MFLTVVLSVRGMAAAHWPGFETGGLFWFTDLTTPALRLAELTAPLGSLGAALPAVVAAALFANIKRSFDMPPAGTAETQGGCLPSRLPACLAGTVWKLAHELQHHASPAGVHCSLLPKSPCMKPSRPSCCALPESLWLPHAHMLHQSSACMLNQLQVMLQPCVDGRCPSEAHEDIPAADACSRTWTPLASCPCSR